MPGPESAESDVRGSGSVRVYLVLAGDSGSQAPEFDPRRAGTGSVEPATQAAVAH